MRWLFVLALSLSSLGWAGDMLGGLGASTRFSEDSKKNLDVQTAPLVFMGTFVDSWLFLGEFLTFKDSTSEGALTVRNRQYELSFYASYFIEYQRDRILNPYIIGGLGFFKNHLEYSLGGAKSKSSSSLEPIVKGGAGIWSDISNVISISIEGKGLLSKKINPKLTPEISLRLFFHF